MKKIQMGIVLGVVITVQLFAPEIRGSIIPSPPESKMTARYDASVDNRIRTLESDAVANKLINEMTFKNSELINEMLVTQEQIATRMENLGILFDKMQDREYERLRSQ